MPQDPCIALISLGVLLKILQANDSVTFKLWLVSGLVDLGRPAC